MRSLNASVGATANETTLASSILKLKSGIRFSTYYICAGFQVGEETPNLHPNLGATGESFPVGPNQSDKSVAIIDRGNIVLRPRQFVCVAHSVDEQRFNIRLQLPQNCVLLHDLAPGIEWKQGFNGSGRTGVKRDRSTFCTRAEKERHVDGD